MARSRLIRIRKTLYARVPAPEARRLALRAGQAVEIDVRPVGSPIEALDALRGRFRGLFRAFPRDELWGEA